MDVGWSDIGSWTGCSAAGRRRRDRDRVVQPGERVEVGADDLVVRRADGAVRVIAAAAGR